jgi:hypothetical protein
MTRVWHMQSVRYHSRTVYLEPASVLRAIVTIQELENVLKVMKF